MSLQKRILFNVTTLVAFALFSRGLLAEENLALEVVTIKGNRELPKVLYIVPWKRLKNDSKNQKLVLDSLFEGVFDPLEPEAFKRQVKESVGDGRVADIAKSANGNKHARQ